MSRKFLLFGLIFPFVLGISARPLHAGYIYPIEIFTDNGGFYDSNDIALYVEVSNGTAGRVDFTFYNESLFDCSIARIYFDVGSFSDVAGITDGPGTSFSRSATPHNLPSGNTLEPSFVTDEDFSFDSDPAPPQNGVNPGEWVRITFALKINGTLEDVIDGLNTCTIRVGAHVIALPDESSESAVTVPEPTSFSLIAIGVLAFLKKRRTQF